MLLRIWRRLVMLVVRYLTACSVSPLNDVPSWLVRPLIVPHTRTVFDIATLPQGSLYRGPDAGQDNLCVCNTVVYSLVSACGACQGASSWIQYALCLSTREFRMTHYA